MIKMKLVPDERLLMYLAHKADFDKQIGVRRWWIKDCMDNYYGLLTD